VKVRYRSSTGGIVGMDMSRGQQGDQGQQGQKETPPKRPGIGSFIPGLGLHSVAGLDTAARPSPLREKVSRRRRMRGRAELGDLPAGR